MRQDVLVGQTTPPDKMGVWAFEPSLSPNACVYYRVEVPMRGLADLGLAECIIDKATGQKELTIQAMLHADIDLLYATSDDSETGIARVVRGLRAGHDNNGGAIYPPSLVYDLDDNVDYLHPFNPAFSRLGTRAGDGTLLEAGDNITTIMPDGRELTVWKDRETQDSEGTLFDIERNKQTVRACHDVARLCHGVTTPSEMLARYYREIHKCSHVHMFPNTVIESDYWFPNLAPRTDGKVRVLWQGGQSHMGDWWPLREALREFAQEHPEVVFVIWGTKYPWILNVIPENQIEYHPWVSYDAYKIKRGALDCDINIAPLANNIFNRCKSGIKWYEASVGPRPEATLASNVPPYSLEMTDGKNGLLFKTPEEFKEKLSLLVKDADLRRRLAENARDWVHTNRTPKATIPGLFDFYSELRSIRRMEFLQEA